MKAGYDRLLLVFLRTVSASIRITPPPFFKQQSLLFSSLSSRFRYCSATVSRSPLPDEDDLFRRHAKLSRLLFHRFLAPLSNIELCILLFSSQTLFAIFLKNFSFATKSSRTLFKEVLIDNTSRSKYTVYFIFLLPNIIRNILEKLSIRNELLLEIQKNVVAFLKEILIEIIRRKLG